MKKYFILPLFLLLILSIREYTVFAQEVDDAQQRIIPDLNIDREQEKGIPEGYSDFSCFDDEEANYNTIFESNLNSPKNKIKSNEDIDIKIDLKNTKNYPILNFDLILEVTNYKNNSYILEKIEIAKNINIKSNESLILEKKWKIPEYFDTNKYNFHLYLKQDDFMLRIGRLDFGKDRMPYLEIESINQEISINREYFYVDGFPERSIISAGNFKINEGLSKKIGYKIKNNTNESKELNIVWNKNGNLISEYKIKIEANQELIIDREFLSEKDNYEINSIIKYDNKEQKIYFNIKNPNQISKKEIIDFITINKYPLIEDQEIKTFACVSNFKQDTISIVTKILDRKGNVVFENKKDNLLKGRSLIIEKIKSNKDLRDFSLIVEMYEDDILIDKKSAEYKCDELIGDCGNGIINLITAILIFGIVLAIFYFFRSNELIRKFIENILIINKK